MRHFPSPSSWFRVSSGSPALPTLWLSVPRNTMEALPACLLRDVIQDAQGVAVIGIDEGQFVS